MSFSHFAAATTDPVTTENTPLPHLFGLTSPSLTGLAAYLYSIGRVVLGAITLCLSLVCSLIIVVNFVQAQRDRRDRKRRERGVK